MPKADHHIYAIGSKIYTFGGFSDMGFNSLNVSFFDLEPPAQINDIKFGGISKKILSFVNYLYHLFVFIRVSKKWSRN